MHLTNASGQTVSLLNEADLARSRAKASPSLSSLSAVAASPNSPAKRQWTATVVATTKSSPTHQQQQYHTSHQRQHSQSSRPSLPSLHELSIAAEHLQRSEREQEERAAAAVAATSSGEARSSTTTSTSTSRRDNAANSLVTEDPAARSRHHIGSSPPSVGRPSLTHSHSHSHHSHSTSPAATSSSTTTSLHPYSSTAQHHKPSRPSLTTDSRYYSSPSVSSSSSSLPTNSSLSSLPSIAGSRNSSSSSVSLPYHLSQQQSSSPAAPHSAHDSRRQSHPHPPHTRPPLQQRGAYTRKSSCSSSASAGNDLASAPPAGYSSHSDNSDSPVFSPGIASSQSNCTPQLLRNDSASTSISSYSARSSAQTPSPMTPTFGFDPLEPNKSLPHHLHPASGPPDYSRAAAAASAAGSNGPYFTNAAAMQHVLSQSQGLALGPQGIVTMAPNGLQQTTMISPTTQTNVFAFTSGTTPLGFDETAFIQPGGLNSYAIPGVTADLIQPSPIANINTSSVSPQNPHAQPATTNGANGQQANGNSSNPSQQKAKKKYPCPHAARFGCTDTFTTSGHAARHGKKHTGEKNILCPTCNKAFTRKDNMKQHERTHRNNNSVSSASGNNSTRRESVSGDASEGAASAASKESSAKRSKTSSASVGSSVVDTVSTPSTLPTSGLPFSPLPANAAFTLDNDLIEGGPSPGADELGYGSLMELAPTHKASRPGNERKISEGGQSMDGEGESPGLDALAMAASGMS